MINTTEIRKEALKRRRSIDSEIKREKSLIICDRSYEKASLYEDILCFYPLEDEVDLRPLYKRLLAEDKRLYFPVTVGDDISFYRVRDLSLFKEGKFSVMEPSDRSEPFEKGAKVLCITPGVAFDKKGNRIGFGKGYYDRFFAKSEADIIKMGVTFSECLFEEIPAEPWDVPMDKVVTDLFVSS